MKSTLYSNETENFENFGHYLDTLTMHGSGEVFSNMGGEAKTVLGRYVLETNDWGQRDVAVFKDYDDALFYASSEMGPGEWLEDIIISTDILRENDSESVWVATYWEGHKSTLVATALENGPAFSLGIQEWCSREQYWPNLWNDSGQLLKIDDTGVHFADIPQPIRYA